MSQFDRFAVLFIAALLSGAAHADARSISTTECQSYSRDIIGAKTGVERLVGDALKKEERAGGIMVCTDLRTSAIVDALWLSAPETKGGTTFYRLFYDNQHLLEKYLGFEQDYADYIRVETSRVFLVCQPEGSCIDDGKISGFYFEDDSPGRIPAYMSAWRQLVSQVRKQQDEPTNGEEPVTKLASALDGAQIDVILVRREDSGGQVVSIGTSNTKGRGCNIDLFFSKLADRPYRITAHCS